MLGGKQGALWKCGNGELIILQHKKNLVCVPSPVGLVSVLRPALWMAIVKVPKNAALMAVDMFARNQWVCTLTINIPEGIFESFSLLTHAQSFCLLTLNLSLLCIMSVTTVQNWQVCSCLK